MNALKIMKFYKNNKMVNIKLDNPNFIEIGDCTFINSFYLRFLREFQIIIGLEFFSHFNSRHLEHNNQIYILKGFAYRCETLSYVFDTAFRSMKRNPKSGL